MKAKNVIRAWKNEEYRDSLSAAEREAMPENPVGLVEIAEKDLHMAAGGYGTITNNSIWTWSGGCCC